MNQILNNGKNSNRNSKYVNNSISTQNNTSSNDNVYNNNYISNTKNNVKQYKIQFFSSLIILIIAISLLISNMYSYAEKERVSKSLLNAISITKLYSNTENYVTDELSSNSSIILDTSKDEQEEPFVIGIIQIDKINVNYPILSNTSKELLKISLCRCAGPMPNEIGNLCIAGHNLVDYKLFSRLNELNLKDTVRIYDLKGNVNEYEIFEKYEVSPTDLSCLNQNTNGNKIITLLTCNNVNGKRLIVVGKEI